MSRVSNNPRDRPLSGASYTLATMPSAKTIRNGSSFKCPVFLAIAGE
jgi:hypothetical protein